MQVQDVPAWEEAKAGLARIDTELQAMGGNPLFNCVRPCGYVDSDALPPGCVDIKAYEKRLEDVDATVHALLSKVQSLQDERNDLVEQKKAPKPWNARDLQRDEDRMRTISISLAQHAYDINMRKNALLCFMETHRPIDASAYLARKHALLDEKLELLREVRLYELGHCP
jgi:outer membrane murein-binding lipoprotein Lpp